MRREDFIAAASEPQIGQIVLCAFPSTMYAFLPCDGSQAPYYNYSDELRRAGCCYVEKLDDE
jgi:hypothetical protein